jgi:membrane protein insertase Oxa1/YidC/SpoIIIJ
MELEKKEKINPMASCLPILIQVRCTTHPRHGLRG